MGNVVVDDIIAIVGQDHCPVCKGNVFTVVYERVYKGNTENESSWEETDVTGPVKVICDHCGKEFE